MKTEEGASIELTIQQTPTVALLDPKKKEELYAFLENEIAVFVPDLSTESGRKQIASLAYKVSRTKTAIDDAGALLKSEWLKKSQAIDASRKEIRDKLDILRDKARKPLTDWEQAEEARQAFVQSAFATLSGVVNLLATDGPAEIANFLKLTEEYELNPDTFQELYSQAVTAKNTAIASLRAALGRSQKEEADRIELARLRAESEARAESDRKAAEAAELARLTKEREDRETTRLAEMAEAAKLTEEQRVKREAENIKKAAEEAEARVKRELEAAAKKEADRIEAEHQSELAKARKAQEAAEAAQREANERIERDKRVALEAERIRKEQADKKAKEDEKIAASKKHRAAVMTAAKVALVEHCGLDEETARKVVLAISTDKIPAVSWSWIA